jgi:acyl carrier protein
MSQTFIALQKLVAERLQKEEAELRPDTTLESLGIDSLGQIELMFDLEDHFDVRFGNHQEPLGTLQDVAALIDQAKTTAPGP